VANLIQLFDAPGAASWRQANVHLFASDTSLRWWWRQHKREAVERGAAVLHAGKWSAIEPAMTQLVIEIAQRNARRAIEVAE
jgi:hypothetical protein